MKIVMKLVSFVIAFASVAMFTSCSESKKAEATADATEVVNEEPQMVIRYIDEDSLLAQYNLANKYGDVIISTRLWIWMCRTRSIPFITIFPKK